MSKKLPFIKSDIPRDLRMYLDRMRELVSGSGTDRLISLDDLTSAGLAGIDSSGVVIPPAQPFVATPPAPTNVSATAAIRTIFVEWDAPAYPGHAYAEVWGASTDSLAAAVLLGMSPGGIYIDETGPSTTRFYWVRFANTNDIKGPYNATNGVSATTGPEVSYLLDTLSGAITESQLFSTLGSRINLIDGDASLAGSVNARVAAEATARANALLAEATARGAAITTETNARQAADTSLASQITTVTAAVGSNAAAIQSEATTRANADSALSSQITTLSSTVNGNTAAIQTEATTRANADNSLFAQYTVKIDTNGYVSGFGLASTANNATPFSDFLIRADRFSIASPFGPGISPIVPFVVTTTPQTINGVSVPVGVYMNAAFVQNGTITNAKIGNAAIDDAKIANLSVGKLTAGSISAGQYIQSSNYVAGTQGFRLDANGNAEFQNAIVRGTVFASSGSFTGTVNATDGEFTGAVNATSGSFTGAVYATSGSFSGSLSGSDITGTSGTFTGTLSASSFANALTTGETITRTTGTYTITVPTGKLYTRMRVTLIGGGGGGGGGAATYDEGSGTGGGGGGGGVYIGTFNVSEGQSFTLNVGAGGAGAPQGSLSGNLNRKPAPSGLAGTGTLLSGGSISALAGGGGGGQGSYSPNQFGTGGSGGSGTTSGSSGQSGFYTVTDPGGKFETTTFHAGAGGAAGQNFGAGGAGGVTAYRNWTLLNGKPGGSYGGGGGGGNTAFNQGGVGGGGNGSGGFAIIEFFNPNGLVLRDEFNALIATLANNGIAFSYTPP